VPDSQVATAFISGGSALLGVLIGGSVTIVAEVVRARGTRSERERDRRAALDDLQRQTLMGLQEAMATWVVTVAELDYQRGLAEGASRVFAPSPDLLKRELTERLLVHRLLGQVRDPTTRDHGREVFRIGVDALAGGVAYQESHASVMSLETDLPLFDEVLGAELRRYL
jgi:hypothetical protein